MKSTISQSTHYGMRALAFALTLLTCTSMTHAQMQTPMESAAWPQSKRVIHVDCAKNQSITRALRRAKPGATIVVSGICHEQVMIRKNYIRLHGKDGAVIDGDIGEIKYPGTITIEGARGAVIKNLTVQNGPDQGIVIQADASARLENVITRGHATVGVSVDSSYAELSDISATNNGGGFDFFTSATVIAQNSIQANSNQGSGVAVNGNATLELRGAIIEANDNLGDGVLLVNNANLMILSFPESQGSGVRLNNNSGNAGMFVASSNIAIVGSQYIGSGANFFDIQNHDGRPGMLLISSNLASPFATARFNLEGNGVGMIMVDNTDVTIVGGLNVRGNFGPGIIGDGAGVLRIEQNETNPSSVAGNRGPDMLMSFGTRLILDEGIANVVICDPTVLTPSGSCP